MTNEILEESGGETHDNISCPEVMHLFFCVGIRPLSFYCNRIVRK